MTWVQRVEQQATEDYPQALNPNGSFYILEVSLLLGRCLGACLFIFLELSLMRSFEFVVITFFKWVLLSKSCLRKLCTPSDVS